ncbi:MAG: hypothetical protein D6800_08640, partial [Candidatus Zixiibacteriota bacterium]
VNKAVELSTPEIKRRGVTCRQEFAEIDWEIIANRNQLVEVFLNLILNALDAMPNGGNLTIKGLREKPEHKKKTYLAVKVIDEGVGISKEHLSRIFDRYFTTKESGTGLGLAVVERIIAAHNGTLAVSSTEGEGTVFTVYFPILD